MEQMTLDRITLAQLPGLGPRGRRALLERGSLGETLAHPEAHKDLLSEAARARLGSGEAGRAAEEELQRAAARGVGVVALGTFEYPAWLAQTFDPPPVLYVRGRLEPEEGIRSVAVVGARVATPQGLAFARALAHDLAAEGVTVVSGLARGIDAAAHRGALDAGGRTVAVLGSGLGRIYPAEHESLAQQIVDADGAVVSEFPLLARPAKGNFPRRNRVIAGWGRGVVVVEARERSGALITAQAAQAEGRDVMAVPGHPTCLGSAGPIGLIRDGATPVRDASDVLQEMEFTPTGSQKEEETKEEDDVLDALRRDAPSSVDDLAVRCGLGLPDLLARLGELELGGRVRRLPGPLFVRS